jgi:transcriptional regulator with XRE-family HTH domain
MTHKPKKLSQGRPKTTRMEMMRSRALAIGVNTSTLSHWENDGCNIEDDDSVRSHVAKLQRTPKGINPEYLTATDQADETPDISALKVALLRTLDEKEARRIKTQIDGLLSAQKLEVLNASYISMVDVKEAFTKLGSVIRAGIMRMQADIPPALEGQSPSRMAKIIGESAEKILTELSLTESELWQAD